MGKFIDLSERRFGNWLVIQRVFLKKGRTHWLCKCDCGKNSFVTSNHLLGGYSTKCKSCHGFEAVKCRSKKHGNCVNKSSKEYRCWAGMKTRCYNPKSTNYKYYGMKGVKICEKWLYSFEAFLKDMGKVPKGLTLDRINPFGDYSPENCRWATLKQQSENKRSKIKKETPKRES